jgi:hypothetical protein
MKLIGKNGYVRDVTDADILELSMHPRDVDKRHSEYLGWENYHEHIVNTFHSSVRSLAFCFNDNSLVGCTGVHKSPHERVGCVWALGTRNSLDILNFKGSLKKSYGNLKSMIGVYEFMKISKYHFEWLFGDDFDVLVNIVENNNKLGQRWLQFLGGKIEPKDDRFSQVTFYKNGRRSTY